jgi:putative tricarboxylic transport membrane protein
VIRGTGPRRATSARILRSRGVEAVFLSIDKNITVTMAPSKLKNGDVISGAVLAGLGVFIIMEARHWDYHSPDGPGPGFFPMWYGVAMLVLSLALIVTTLRRNTQPGEPVVWKEVWHALAVWGAFTLCVALLHTLGFILSFGLLTFFIVAVIYGRPLKVALAVAAGNAVGFYLLFTLGLSVTLPVGKLGF